MHLVTLFPVGSKLFAYNPPTDGTISRATEASFVGLDIPQYR